MVACPYHMGKIRVGNYIFKTWKGDHLPQHVHVFKDKELIVKWDLEHHQPMVGKMNKRLLKIINRLIQEGRL